MVEIPKWFYVNIYMFVLILRNWFWFKIDSVKVNFYVW